MNPISRRLTWPTARWSTILLVIVCCTATLPGVAPIHAGETADMSEDLSTLRQRFRDEYLARLKVDRARQALKTLKDDGTWPDIDYANGRRMTWDPRRHLDRLSAMAIALKAEASPLKGDAELKQAVMRALDNWLEKNYRAPNWWWNRIGIPKGLLPTLFAMWDDLSPAQQKKGLQIVAWASIDMTGQNLVWRAEMSLQRGLLENDAKLVLKAARSIAGVICTTTDEGVQPDFSFHQHGPCWYNLAYGKNFLIDAARLARLLTGTRAAFPKEKVDLLVRYALDGTQWMGRLRECDPGARGRSLTRPYGWDRSFLVHVADDLLQLPVERKDELKAMAARARGDNATPLVGNRMFPYSDVMTHHRPGWYASMRGYGKDILNTDAPHGDEGRLNHYIADGAMFLMRRGDEYRGAWPVFNWFKIPGTTVVQSDKPDGDVRREGNTAFVGGASDGRLGCMAFHLKRSGLSVRKAWFCFEDRVVCLGARLTYKGDDPVATTLQQCHLSGPVFVQGKDGWTKLDAERNRLVGPVTLWHDEVAWQVHGEVAVELTASKHTGSWYRINPQHSKKKVEHDLFTLWIDHGKNPDGVGYVYQVLPGVARDKVPPVDADTPVTVLSNTAEVQAVCNKDEGLVMALFYKPGTVTYNKEESLSVDRPCALIYHSGKQTPELIVTDPTGRGGVVKVTGTGNALPHNAKAEHDGWFVKAKIDPR